MTRAGRSTALATTAGIGLYDRRNDQLTLDEVERILI